MIWSEDQKKIIEAGSANILVSAAAGSGKTTVMVERILEMLSRTENPVSLDQMIIMTFTRAAAAGMRAKLSDGLQKRLAADPDNTRLKLQKAILPRARISTIDSICQGLIKQYYQRLEIDPGFTIADEGEVRLMKGDVLEALLEEKYEAQDQGEGEESFLKLADTFSKKGMDGNLGSTVEKLYSFLKSMPWPEQFLALQREECDREKRGEYSGSAWMKVFFRDLMRDAEAEKGYLETAHTACTDEDGPVKYLPYVEECITLTDGIITSCKKEDYAALQKLIMGMNFTTLPRKTKKDLYDEEKAAYIKAVRDEFKEFIRAWQTKHPLLPEELLSLSLREASDLNRALLDLTEEFDERYTELKKEKNCVDFNDLEHFALKLLYEKNEDGSYRPSALADELAGQLQEIMIDEYQDSNRVQEALLTALSAERFGRPDVFMVGDVKQSIYRFRNAEPELFLEKYDRFGHAEDAADRKIELNCNYRSRAEVIDAVNDVFDRIMRKDLGGIAYDASARLTCMASYPENPAAQTELLLLDTAADAAESGSDGDGQDDDITKEELEYSLLASRIRELICPENSADRYRVTDARTGELRPAEFRDIAILLRGADGHAETLCDILGKNGIPAYFASKKGYFNAREVNMMLSLLGILDNPLQDIPLVTVLRSPFGGFTDDELALIRAAYANQKEEETQPGDFYRALKSIGNTAETELPAGISPKTQKKIRAFLEQLSEWRSAADILPVHMLLNRLYLETGYYNYVSAMPMGSVRKKNLDMLLDRAEQYGTTSYQGLFNFIRYIEALKKYQTDYGEAQTVSENDNIVRIMTIHSSKGLEFPIVFLARAASRLGGKDGGEYIAIDPKYGIGADYTDIAAGILYPGLKKSVIRKHREEENTAEELRLLYTAMTRAKEKLIITAAKSNTEAYLEKLEKLSAITEKTREDRTGCQLPRELILGHKNYLDWILMAVGTESRSIRVSVLTREELKLLAESEVLAELDSWAGIITMDEEEKAEILLDPECAAFSKKLTAALESGYRFEEETKLKPKISVSEIKEMAIEALESGGKTLELPEPESGPKMQGTAGAGALRGTAYHRAMELLSYEGTADEQLAELMNHPRFAQEEKDLLDRNAVREFLKSDIGRRMGEAKKNGTLHREQHFMAGFPACELKDGQNSHELQILQGIIDAYFEEDGEIILVDYKTDRVNSAQELADRYRVQLELYRKALMQLTKKTVRESIIYSTFLKTEIAV